MTDRGYFSYKNGETITAKRSKGNHYKACMQKIAAVDRHRMPLAWKLSHGTGIFCNIDPEPLGERQETLYTHTPSVKTCGFLCVTPHHCSSPATHSNTKAPLQNTWLMQTEFIQAYTESYQPTSLVSPQLARGNKSRQQAEHKHAGV